MRQKIIEKIFFKKKSAALQIKKEKSFLRETCMFFWLRLSSFLISKVLDCWSELPRALILQLCRRYWSAIVYQLVKILKNNILSFHHIQFEQKKSIRSFTSHWLSVTGFNWNPQISWVARIPIWKNQAAKFRFEYHTYILHEILTSLNKNILNHFNNL